MISSHVAISSHNCCGCCGRESGFRVWCPECAKHVLPLDGTAAPWDRTYRAQHGKPCPHQVGVEEHEAALAKLPE